LHIIFFFLSKEKAGIFFLIGVYPPKDEKKKGKYIAPAFHLVRQIAARLDRPTIICSFI